MMERGRALRAPWCDGHSVELKAFVTSVAYEMNFLGSAVVDNGFSCVVSEWTLQSEICTFPGRRAVKVMALRFTFIGIS